MFYRKLYRKMPFINFAISSCALLFQTTVLYPWHKELSLQIDRVENENTKKK